MIGSKFAVDDYPDIPYFFALCIQVLRNALGDLGAPSYEIWLKFIKDREEEAKKNDLEPAKWDNIFSFGMMSLTWFIFFFLNIVILFVVLMNFLIAIVSETYASVMANQEANVYFYKA